MLALRLSFPLTVLLWSVVCLSGWGAEVGKIACEDRKFLTDFFRGLLSQGCFAATLFDKKSAASFDYPPQLIPKMDDPAFKNKFLLEHKGWQVWEKYQHLFEFKNFLFLKLDREYLSVLFVNKKKMQEVLSENREFFQSHFSEDPLKVEMSTFLLKAFLPNFRQNNFHLAQGLLLGYGRESCLAFQERSCIEDTLAYFPYDVSELPRKCSAAPESLLDGFPQDLIQKQNQYKEAFSLKQFWPQTNPFFCATAPGYMAFSIPYNPEIEGLKDQVSALYNSDQFLEDFLTIITR